jgi:hypothetical protein
MSTIEAEERSKVRAARVGATTVMAIATMAPIPRTAACCQANSLIRITRLAPGVAMSSCIYPMLRPSNVRHHQRRFRIHASAVWCMPR